jgi:hypothetical protein
MIVLGYIDRMKWDYRIYANGQCPDSWRGFADESYNPRHLPVRTDECPCCGATLSPDGWTCKLPRWSFCGLMGLAS